MLAIQEYSRFDALGLADLIRRREASAEEILEAALARTREVNGRINAVVIPMFEEAQARVRAGLPNGPFTGVPFLLKDLGAYYPGFRTTGRLPLQRRLRRRPRQRDHPPLQGGRASSSSARRRRPSSGSPPRPSRRSSAPPATRGTSSASPADRRAARRRRSRPGSCPRRTPPTAAARSASRRRAAACSGMKPTRARVSVAPDAGEGWSGLSCGHAVSRSVRDSAALLDAVAGAVPGDPYQAPPPAAPFLSEVGKPPGKLRIALTAKPFNNAPVDAECTAAARGRGEAVRVARARGERGRAGDRLPDAGAGDAHDRRRQHPRQPARARRGARPRLHQGRRRAAHDVDRGGRQELRRRAVRGGDPHRAQGRPAVGGASSPTTTSCSRRRWRPRPSRSASCRSRTRTRRSTSATCSRPSASRSS